jgi:hypothetical protein
MELPNPFTPMAFLPPNIAFQVTIATYILVGSCGVIVWDILNNLNGDYALLFKYQVTLPTIAYFISRLGSLGYVLASTIFETAPTGDCARFEKGLDWLFPVAVPANSLLFLFRIRAIFNKNMYIVSFFTFMWFAVVGGCLTVTQGVTGAAIGPTNYCLNVSLQPYVGAAGIIPAANDTLIFLAISWRMISNAHIDYTLKNGLRALIFGDFMPKFSRALLQDGQIYYLTSVSSFLVTVLVFYAESIPVTYRTMFTVPNIAVMNIMACRVFRNAKFGLYKSGISTGTIRHRGDRGGKSAIPLSFTKSGRVQHHSSNSTEVDTMENGIQVVKTIDHANDYGAHETIQPYNSQGKGTYV